MATKYRREEPEPVAGKTPWETSRTRAWLESEKPGTPGANKLLWLVLPVIFLLYFGGRQLSAPAPPQAVAPEYGPGVITGVEAIDNGMIALEIDLQTPLGDLVPVRIATKEAGWQPGQEVHAAYRLDESGKGAKVTALFRAKSQDGTSESP